MVVRSVCCYLQPGIEWWILTFCLAGLRSFERNCGVDTSCPIIFIFCLDLFAILAHISRGFLFTNQSFYPCVNTYTLTIQHIKPIISQYLPLPLSKQIGGKLRRCKKDSGLNRRLNKPSIGFIINNMQTSYPSVIVNSLNTHFPNVAKPLFDNTNTTFQLICMIVYPLLLRLMKS